MLPYDVATDDERMYVADISAAQLSVLDLRGARVDTIALERAPRSVALASDGILYVS